MNTDIGVLELNDAGLRLFVGGRQGKPSPGYATISGDTLLLGNEALHQAHLHPLQTNNQFWHRLSAEPLPMHNTRYRHHADLAYSHLIALYNEFAAELEQPCDRFVVALPGNFTREQIALLLGIVDQCPFNIVGLIDGAVAGSASIANVGSCLHVDAQLHQCVFTTLSVSDSVKREQIEVLPNLGLLSLRGKFAKSIADQFVDQSRFDPLHSAESEQSIYDQLPTWMAQSITQTDLILEVSGKTAKVSRSQLIAPMRGYYQQIAQQAVKLLNKQGQLLIGYQLASLPGLLDEINRVCNESLGIQATALSDATLVNGIQQHLDIIVKDNGELAFVQSLPVSADVASADTAHGAGANPAATCKPTHVLVENMAYKIGQAPIFINKNNTSQLVISNQASKDTIAILQAQGDEVALLPQGKLTLLCNGRTINDNHAINGGDKISATGIPGQLHFIEVRDGP